MVGVCLTAIGLIGSVKSLGNIETAVDDLLAARCYDLHGYALASFLGLLKASCC